MWNVLDVHNEGSVIFQLILADGNATITCNLKNAAAVRAIERVRGNLQTGYKITFTNFQKNRGMIYTSSATMCEVDDEVHM